MLVPPEERRNNVEPHSWFGAGEVSLTMTWTAEEEPGHRVQLCPCRVQASIKWSCSLPWAEREWTGTAVSENFHILGWGEVP